MAKTFIPLSPLDHVFTGSHAYPIQFRFSYQAPLDAAALETSLRETMEAFSPFRSQLEQVDDISYGLVPSDNGFAFEVSNVPGELPTVKSIPGQPLVKVHLSREPRSSTLSVSMSHAVADGYSYFYFLASWAKVFQGKGFSVPFLDRRRLVPADFPTEKITPELLREQAGVEYGESRKDFPPEKLKCWSLHYPDAELKQLTRACRKESDISLFENDVLCALIAKKVAEGRSGALAVTMPVDFRRLLRELPSFYIGNAFHYARAEMTAEWIASHSLTEVAVAIRRPTGRVRAEEAKRGLAVLEGLRHQAGLEGLGPIKIVDPTRGILISNMSRLPVEHLDFGAGAPTSTFFQSPGPGIIGILAAKDGLEVHFAEEEK